ASETWMMRRSGPGLSLWARSRAVRFGMRVSYPQLKRRPAIWPMASLGCIPGVHQGYTKRPVTPCCAVLATQRNASTNPLSLLGFSWNFVLRPVAWCNPSAALRAGKGLLGNGGRGGAATLPGAAADHLSRPRRHPRRHAKRLSRGVGPGRVALPAWIERIQRGEDAGTGPRLEVRLATGRTPWRRTQRTQDVLRAAGFGGVVALTPW